MEEQIGILLAQVADLSEQVKSLDRNLLEQLLPVAGAFFGAFIPYWWLHRAQIKHDRSSVRAALGAEISAIQELIEKRHYREGLFIVHAEAERGGKACFSINTPDEYFHIFRASLDKLGLLTPQEARLVVRFYQLMESLIQDVKPGGLLAEGGVSKAHIFHEAIVILDQALEAASEAVALLNQDHASIGKWKLPIALKRR